MGDWNVDVDQRANRLYIKLAGHMDAEEAKVANDAVMEAARGMDPDFEVVTDISDFVPGDQDAVKYIEKGKKVIKENGAAAAVRVTGNASATGQMHFENVGDDHEDYPVAMAETVEEAEKLLDSR
ncbi:MAG: hypothetical protein ABEJ31_02915 [Haloarculaceae archaeon]